MIWHIFKKDLRLLWGVAAAVAAMQVICVVLLAWFTMFRGPHQLAILSGWLGIAWLVGLAGLCVSLMHQDAIPGDRQDWLVRPIARGHLIIGKLLFVLIGVQLPVLLVNVGEGLFNGFGLMPSAAAALSHNISILCFASLPGLLIGVVTRTVSEAFLFVVAGLVAFIAIFGIGVMMLLGVRGSIGGTGLAWMIGAAWQILAVLGTVLVLAIQFFWRKTALARSLIGAGAAMIALTAFMPWRGAFAIQQLLSREPDAANGVALTFNPQLGPFVPPPGAGAATSASLYLPLRVSGVPSNAIVLMDRAEVRITDLFGKEIYTGKSDLSIDGAGSIQDARFEVHRAENGAAAVDTYQRIFVPPSMYERLRDQPVDVSIDYSLTLLGASAHFALAADGARAQLGNLGLCTTRVDGDGDAVELQCMNTKGSPTCFTAVLEHPPSGERNPEIHRCSPVYSPFNMIVLPSMLSGFGGEVPFFDRAGLTHYPVDGTKLAGARLAIDTYEARDHFTRRLDIPNVQLTRFAGN